MHRFHSLSRIAVVSATLALVLAVMLPVSADFKPEHRKELAEIKKDVAGTQSMITKKEFDEAEKVLAECEARLKKLAGDAMVEETDRALVSVVKQIELKRQALAKKQGAGAPTGAAATVSFEKDVAPTLVAKCLRCHGDTNPRAGLSMNTFAGIVAGGNSKMLIQPGNPAASLLVRKISMTGMGKMPPMGDAVTPDEIKKIAAWIAGGAKFGGDNATPIRDLATTPTGAPASKVEIVRATGTEKVSFSRDVAPWMVNLCMNCHSGANARSGFSIETFEKLMQGGNSGRVVVPGNTKASRIVQLVYEQDPIKMPPGQALTRRQDAEALVTWVEEGAKFDGGDPKANLRTIAVSEDSTKAKALASMTSEQWVASRLERTEAMWKQFTQDPMSKMESADVLLVGNASDSRLKEVLGWVNEDLENLKKMLAVKETPAWKGKLAIFVIKDRVGYSEFVQSTENREPPADTTGHSRVTPTQEDAFIVLEDTGNEPSENSPGLRGSLLEHLTSAVLQRSGGKIPRWASRGTGLILAARSDPKNPYFHDLAPQAYKAVSLLSTPQELFQDGTFSGGDLGAVGYTLVNYMVANGGEAQFVKFLQAVNVDGNVGAALQSVYSADQVKLANGYAGALSKAKPRK